MELNLANSAHLERDLSSVDCSVSPAKYRDAVSVNQLDDQFDRMSVIMLSPQQMIGKEAIAAADEARVLRASVYIDQRNFLPDSARDTDGGEHDEDDLRSTHFLAVRTDSEENHLATIGNLRLIHRDGRGESFARRPLPIESFYPEHFAEHPVLDGGFEVSRFVTDRRHGLAARIASAALIRTSLDKALTEDWGPGFAVIEAPLEHYLSSVGVRMRRLTSGWVPEYNTQNLAVEFDLEATRDAIEAIRRSEVSGS